MWPLKELQFWHFDAADCCLCTVGSLPHVKQPLTENILAHLFTG